MLTTTSSLLLEGLADPANQEVWREFHERYRPVLLGFARKLGLDEDEAADAAQETLLRFVEEYRAGRYDRDRGRLRSWIFTLARSRILDLSRRRGRERPARGESVLAHVAAEDELDAAWDAEWRRAVLRQGLLELRATTRIDERTLRVFERIALEERSPASVAAELGMTTNAVYVAKHRALAQLREILARVQRDF